jgi:regulator of sigma E protease
MRGERLNLMVTDRDGRGQRRVGLDLDTLPASEVDAKLMQSIGIGSAFSEPVLGEVRAGGPAAKAGLRAGDRVVSIDGESIADASRVRDLIRASGKSGVAKPMRWRVQRGIEPLELTVTPSIVVENEQRVGRIEVYPGQPPEMVSVRYGVFDGISKAVSQTWNMSVLTLKMLGKMIIGQASLKNLSGPLTIADYAGQSVKLGLAYYLGLLPLPVLDGGHLMYYLFEGLTGRPVSELWLDRLQRGGVAIMLMMMSLALYNDMARLLGLH